MKQFEPVTFDFALASQQVAEFRALLETKAELAEAAEVLPFFQERRHLAVLMGMFNPRIAWADRIAYEFDIFGDFACDLAVGEASSGAYCFIEFEDARANSVFEKQGKKATREWSRRFDHGYSQIIDWLHKLDDRAGGFDFVSRFGRPSINYETVLVVGRDQHLDEGERVRLDWRSGNVVINSKRVYCLTFDQLLGQLSTRLSSLALVAEARRAVAAVRPTPEGKAPEALPPATPPPVPPDQTSPPANPPPT